MKERKVSDIINYDGKSVLYEAEAFAKDLNLVELNGEYLLFNSLVYEFIAKIDAQTSDT